MWRWSKYVFNRKSCAYFGVVGSGRDVCTCLYTERGVLQLLGSAVHEVASGNRICGQMHREDRVQSILEGAATHISVKSVFTRLLIQMVSMLEICSRTQDTMQDTRALYFTQIAWEE